MSNSNKNTTQSPSISKEKGASRSEYHHNYYLKRKEEKNRPMAKVIQLFKSLKKTSSSKGKRTEKWATFTEWASAMILFVAACTLTAVLVQEAAAVYLDAQESSRLAYFKAGLIEMIAILLSAFKIDHHYLNRLKGGTVALLCCLTVWAMSGKAIKTAADEATHFQFIQQELKSLEKEISEKEALRNGFISKGRLTMTSIYEKRLDEARKRQSILRKETRTTQPMHVVLNTLCFMIVLRLALLISNLFCIHLLKEKIQLLLFQKNQLVPENS